MKYITEAQVRENLPVSKCIEVLRTAFSHAVINIPRYRLKSEHSLLHVMSASIPDLGIMGLKTYGISRTGEGTFVVLLFNEMTGELMSMLEGDTLGQIRTGAASGLATDLLANPDARIGAVIGTGLQAWTQLQAIDAVRAFDEIRIFSRSHDSRKSFIEKMQPDVRARLVEAPSAELAVAGADVISTITGSREPVLEGKWLKAGCHINAAGVNWANKRELDEDAVTRSGLICVDHIEQSKIESGDLIPVLKNWDGVVELTDVVQGKAKRMSREQITLFKSNGIAAEDIAAALYVYNKV